MNGRGRLLYDQPDDGLGRRPGIPGGTLRRLLPWYVGTVFVETYRFDADRCHPASAEAVGGGSMSAPVPGKGIFAHRESEGVLHTHVQLTRDRAWVDALDSADGPAALERVAGSPRGGRRS